MTQFDNELKIAIETVKVATEITKWFSNVGFKSFQKQDNTPVTLADYASQFFITFRIAQFFPEDQIIAEETDEIKLSVNDLAMIKACYDDLNIAIEMDLSQKRVKSKRQWTVDPIDGTKGFQKNLSYAIGIGLMINSNPRISIIGVPNWL